MKRVVLITGGASGLGLATAAELAKDAGNTVVIASRNMSAVDAAVKKLNSQSGRDNVRGLHLDLGSLAGVAAFTKDLTAQFPRVDVLLCNAGVAGVPYTLSPEGFESTFATNHLGHLLLIDSCLAATPPPSRIVIVSSGTHDPSTHSGAPAPEWTTTEALAHPQKYDANVAYSSSKLANAMTGKYLARHLDAKTASVARALPPPCHTPR